MLTDDWIEQAPDRLRLAFHCDAICTRSERAAQARPSLRSLRMRVIHYLVDRGKEGRVELNQPIIRWAVELRASHEALIASWLKWSGKERTATAGTNTDPAATTTQFVSAVLIIFHSGVPVYDDLPSLQHVA
jgi:hypothetical protein